MTNFKDEFLIDDEVIFFNHGSFGACPRAVFKAYQEWQAKLEHQPVKFLGRQATELMAHAREKLAVYLNTEAENLVYFPNPTTAINMVGRSLQFEPGDEILSTDHEYGAMDRTWRFLCGKTGAHYVKQKIPIPVTNLKEFVELFWDGVTPKTRVIFISHITSPTALIFPVEEICRRARDSGIFTIVDGAHAPGQIPVDLSSIDADVYTGACHKWLCAPKGSSFLFVRPEIQSFLEPLVVSWGYESDDPSSSQFIDYHEWQGTRDLAAFLSVPRAIKYLEENNWDEVRHRCHKLASDAYRKIYILTGMEPISPDSPDWFSQMVSLRLPGKTDPEELKLRLRKDYRIETPAFYWNEIPIIRLSFQAYNDGSEIEILLGALKDLFI